MLHSPIAAPAVPDFFDLLDQPGPDWSCSLGDEFVRDMWSVDCFDCAGDAIQLGGITADDLTLCLVPDIALLGRSNSNSAEDESSGASDMTFFHGSIRTANRSFLNVLSEDCTSAPATKSETEPLNADAGSIIACSVGALPKLRLDYSNVLSEWEQMGGSVAAVDAGVASQANVTLCLPLPETSTGSLPSYDLSDPTCVLPPPASLLPHGGGDLDSSGGMAGGAMRLASLQSSGPGSLSSVGDMLLGCRGSPSPRGGSESDCSSEGSCFANSLLNAHSGAAAQAPRLRATQAARLLPQSLAAIPAKATECARSARAACFMRYKEKKQNRKSGKIRYEMRKINAEKRPRIRGRFVKREELNTMLAASSGASLSPRSAASSMCASSWL